MRRASLAPLPCPIARTLDLVGEWWSLLIVRDALFGARRFDDFTATGIADNVLSARLKRLVEAGIFERRRYQVRPDRYEYLLAEKGQQLAPVIAALAQWGAAWTSGEDRNPRLLHAACGHAIAVAAVCPHCDTRVPAGDIVRVRDGVESPLVAVAVRGTAAADTAARGAGAGLAGGPGATPCPVAARGQR